MQIVVSADTGTVSPSVESSQVSSRAVFTASDGRKFLTLPDGSALVDTGAGQDLIESSALASTPQRLCEQGLEAVVVHHTLRTAKGTGGKSTSLPKYFCHCASGEHWGSCQHVNPADALRQNGQCERQGGWVKTRLQGEMRAGETVVVAMEEMDRILQWLVACKDRFFHRGGCTPLQLLFAKNPRLPT